MRRQPASTIGGRSQLENNAEKNEPISVSESPWKTRVISKKFFGLIFIVGVVGFLVFLHSFHKSPVATKPGQTETKLSNDAKGRVLDQTNTPPKSIELSPNSRNYGVVSPEMSLAPNGPNVPPSSPVMAPGTMPAQRETGHNTFNGHLLPSSPVGGMIAPNPSGFNEPVARKPQMSFSSYNKEENSSGNGQNGGSPKNAYASLPGYHPVTVSPPSGGAGGTQTAHSPLMPTDLGSSILNGLSGGSGGAQGSYASANDQSGKEKFLRKAEKESREAYLTAYPVPARSRYEIVPGTMIPGVLLTRLNSDTPGNVSARVSANVFNDRAGHHNEVLIPANSRLEGHYSSSISMGQTRVQVVWDRIIFPDQSTLELHGMNGTDSEGTAGFHDQVDNHYVKIFGAALVLSVFSAAAQLSQPMNGSALTAPTESQIAAGAVGQNMSMVGSQITQQYMNIQPTLVVREGYPFNIYVDRVMMFPKAYKAY